MAWVLWNPTPFEGWRRGETPSKPAIGLAKYRHAGEALELNAVFY